MFEIRLWPLETTDCWTICIFGVSANKIHTRNRKREREKKKKYEICLCHMNKHMHEVNLIGEYLWFVGFFPSLPPNKWRTSHAHTTNHTIQIFQNLLYRCWIRNYYFILNISCIQIYLFVTCCCCFFSHLNLRLYLCENTRYS